MTTFIFQHSVNTLGPPVISPAGVLSASICVKMIMIMWIIHVGDLKTPVISSLQIRHYVSTGSIL